MKIPISLHDAVLLVSHGGVAWMNQAEEPVSLASGAKVTSSYEHRNGGWQYYIEGTEDQIRETHEVLEVPTEEAITAAASASTR